MIEEIFFLTRSFLPGFGGIFRVWWLLFQAPCQRHVKALDFCSQMLKKTKADGLIGALDGLPLNELTKGDRNDVLNVLDGVRSKIEEIYNDLNPQPAPTAPVNSGGPSTNLA